MSYQASANIVNRMVKAQEDLKTLKASQTIASSNMSYYEYKLPRIESTIPNRNIKTFLILTSSKNPFPLVSIELKIQEKVSGNWVDRPNPLGISCPAYGATRNSLASYSFYDNDSIVSYSWGVNYVDLYGRRFEFSDPKVYAYLIYMGNYSNQTVSFAFDNIKVRCSSLAEVWMTETTEIL